MVMEMNVKRKKNYLNKEIEQELWKSMIIRKQFVNI